ncbi:hypothetical protein GCM10028806_12770 [Spirosoma terrae]
MLNHTKCVRAKFRGSAIGKAFVLTKGQKKVAALVPIAMLNKLAELEDFYKRTKGDGPSMDSSLNADNQINGESEQ